VIGPVAESEPASRAEARPARVRAFSPRLPLAFEPNLGQADPQVRFVARDRRFALLLAPTEISLALPAGAPGPVAGSREPGPRAPGRTVRIRLVGASPAPLVSGRSPLAGRSHYFVGDDPRRWRTDIPLYARVESRGVYPGVTLVLHGTRQGLLEYDFVVAAGADPGRIGLRVEGADSVEMNRDGDLVLAAASARILMRKPGVYQEHGGARRPVTAAYALDGDSVIRFRLGRYDPTLPLVIDPVLSYASYLGGSGAEQAFAVAVDRAGNAHVVGETTSAGLAGAGAAQSTLAGGVDVFVMKVNAGGTALLYATYLGGAGTDAGRGIALDAAGNAYITGFTDSADLPTTASAPQRSLGGATDAFVAKLDSTGSRLLYATYLGGSGSDVGLAIAADGAGNASVTGGTFSADFPTVGAIQRFPGGARDAFVTQLATAGPGILHSTYLGGRGTDVGHGIALDSGGRLYIVGETTSADFPVSTGALQPRLAGATDAFVTKLAPTAPVSTIFYSTYLGGSGVDTASGVAVDAFGSAHLAGTTASPDFPLVPGSPSSQAFAAKVDPSGRSLSWATPVAGGLGATGNAVALDRFGTAYVAGSQLRCGAVIALGCANISADAFLSAMSLGGAAIPGTFVTLGGSADDVAWGVAVDSNGNAYVVGETASTDFATTPGALRPTGQPPEAFVAKIASASDPGGGNPDGDGRDDDRDGDGTSCFIAITLVGSSLAREIDTLRAFRDRFLAGNAPGRRVVDLYDRVSPPLGRMIARSATLRATARALLHPVVWWARLALASPAAALAAASGLLVLAGAGVRLLRRARARGGRP
jgi:hypothetical protein